MMLLSTACFAWALLSLALPLAYNIKMLLTDGNGDMHNIDFISFGAGCVGLLLLWAISIAAGLWSGQKKQPKNQEEADV